MKKILILMLFISKNIQAQDQKKAENTTPAVTTSYFSSIISNGYRPTEGNSYLSMTYLSFKYNYDTSVSLTNASGSTKLNETDSKISSLTNTYSYSLTERLALSIRLTDVFEGSSSYKYTSTAKSSGYTDYSSKRSGLTDPSLLVDYLSVYSNDFRLSTFVSISPKLSNRKDSNVVRGGSEYSIGINAYKRSGIIEFGGGIEITRNTGSSEENDSTTYDTDANGNTQIHLDFNIFALENGSISIQIGKSSYNSTTTKSNKGSKYITAGYSTTSYLLGYQYAMVSNIAVLFGIYSETKDSISTILDTIKFTSDSVATTAVGLGLKFGF
ncbi:MAG: hypothetical protein L6Q37_13720 [Bdellovibrionaceae bacterium]|nr:hypothetical protein [Pseudobdellovibrionaceae bacterium]NUM59883.1 hypothetical protein [Pseudobdellovibrionaceae bacterium]